MMLSRAGCLWDAWVGEETFRRKFRDDLFEFFKMKSPADDIKGTLMR